MKRGGRSCSPLKLVDYRPPSCSSMSFLMGPYFLIASRISWWDLSGKRLWRYSTSLGSLASTRMSSCLPVFFLSSGIRVIFYKYKNFVPVGEPRRRGDTKDAQRNLFSWRESLGLGAILYSGFCCLQTGIVLFSFQILLYLYWIVLRDIPPSSSRRATLIFLRPSCFQICGISRPF